MFYINRSLDYKKKKEKKKKDIINFFHEHMENRWMCKLQTRHGTGLNIDCGPYVKEVYNIWSQTTLT